MSTIKVTDMKDRNTCVLFGDGAGAVVLSEVKVGGIISSILEPMAVDRNYLKYLQGCIKNQPVLIPSKIEDIILK